MSHKVHDEMSAVALPVPARLLTKFNVAMCIFHGTLAAVTLGIGNKSLRVPVYSSSVTLNVGSRVWPRLDAGTSLRTGPTLTTRHLCPLKVP